MKMVDNEINDEDDEVFWLISPDNEDAKQWFARINELERINIKDLTITRVDSYWDGPLKGIAEYKGRECYFVAIFDEEAPSLSIDVGRCYLLFEMKEELRIVPEVEISEDDPDLDYSKPIGYFGGSLGYFMTHLDRFKDKKMY